MTTYQLQGPLDFKEVPQLNPLVKRALAAANAGQPFRETVVADDAGQELTLYLQLNYDDGEPTSIEVGQELPPPENVVAAARLPKRYGCIEVRRKQPWATAPLVRKD